MKTKIKIKEIEDKITNVPVNSPERRIWEIKRELAEDAIINEDSLKAQVFKMWQEGRM